MALRQAQDERTRGRVVILNLFQDLSLVNRKIGVCGTGS